MVALVAVLLIAATVTIIRNTGAGGPITDQDYPTPTISGWDDSKPTDSPSPPPPSEPDGAPVACPIGNPNLREAHPADDRVYGGNLSFPAAGNFEPAMPEARLSFAYDVTQQVRQVNTNPGWIAQLAVGALRGTDFTGDAKKTAGQLMQCAETTQMYLPYGPTRNDLRSEAITVSGQKGWLVESDIAVSKEGLPFAGDKVIFIVVPNGEDWGMFFGAVPIGDAGLTDQLGGVVRDLRVG